MSLIVNIVEALVNFISIYPCILESTSEIVWYSIRYVDPKARGNLKRYCNEKIKG